MGVTRTNPMIKIQERLKYLFKTTTQDNMVIMTRSVLKVRAVPVNWKTSLQASRIRLAQVTVITRHNQIIPYNKYYRTKTGDFY